MLTAPELLHQWTNFYVIVGSSAGALTGLQFVVIALIADANVTGSISEIRAFGSPTVVHFCAALFVAANLTVPWQTLANAGRVLAALGVVGTLYILNALRHARRQAGYKPDAEDWFWYVVLPLFLYLALLVAGAELQSHPERSLFAVAAVAVALLGAGIHNAWDTVTYVAVVHARSGSGAPGKNDPDESGRS